MPMIGVQLGQAIKEAVDKHAALPADESEVNIDKYRDGMYTAMGNAIVKYLKENAIVQVEFVTGVFTGGGVSGPGQGKLL